MLRGFGRCDKGVFVFARTAQFACADNVYYALRIAAALSGDWKIAEPALNVALKRSYADNASDTLKVSLS
jgi:hypothetical protein